jgi:hypothetical protein
MGFSVEPNNDTSASRANSALKKPEATPVQPDESEKFTSKTGIKLNFYADSLPAIEKTLSKDVAVKIIAEALDRYPDIIMKKLPATMNVQAKGGSVPYPEIVICPEKRTVHHEIFHYLDRRDAGDEPKLTHAYMLWWRNVNVATKEYEEKCMETPEAAGAGYARKYGTKDQTEDMATVAEMLFTVDRVKLKERLTDDPILKTKVEMVTNCEYDVLSGRFTRLFTAAELKDKFAADDNFFYAKWSTVDGKVLMDADYWNRLISTFALPTL